MVKPPSKRIASDAGKALRGMKISKKQKETLGGRVEAERAAAAKKKKKRKP